MGALETGVGCVVVLDGLLASVGAPVPVGARVGALETVVGCVVIPVSVGVAVTEGDWFGALETVVGCAVVLEGLLASVGAAVAEGD